MTQLIVRPVTTVYASDIGLKPGEWPTEIVYEGWTWINPEPFCGAGELRHVTYKCNGRKLVVIND